MTKLIKGCLSGCILLLILVTITFCVSVALHDDTVYADEYELPQDKLLVKGAAENVPWEYGYNTLENWQAYTLGTPVTRLGNYNGTDGCIVAWTTTIENFKKCGVLTKIALIKTEDGSELASCTATDPEKGIQKSDFPITSLNRLWPGMIKNNYNKYNGICFNNITTKNEEGALWNMQPYTRDIDTYVAIQGTGALIHEDTNYDYTVILYFNGSENAPAIPEEVQDVIDAIDAIGEVTENNYAEKETLAIVARTAYDALESQELKGQVTNYDILNAAEASIDLFKARTSAKGELDTLLAGKNEADYDADDWTALTTAISDGKDAIDAATTTDGVTKAKSAAENAVSAIKTKAQKAEAELAAAKTKAKGELDTLLAGKNEADYDADDWTALTTAISDGKDAIDAATTTDGVTKAKSAAENAVEAIKTKKQKAAEKAEKIKKQKAAAKKYKVAGLKVTSKNRKFTISWKKTKGASGYQVQYRLKGSKKYKTLKALTKTKVISKKLKLNKKYQFRVRTYTKINGIKVYGNWTKVKTVKCRRRK